MRSVLISTGARVGLERHGVVGDALQQARQFVAVVEHQPVGVAGGSDEAIEQRVVLLAVGRRVKDNAGERFQRQFQRAEADRNRR